MPYQRQRSDQRLQRSQGFKQSIYGGTPKAAYTDSSGPTEQVKPPSRIINQITAPDQGSIQFKDQPIGPEHRHLIGYLPEERGLYKKMKVGEQALYLAQLKGLPSRKP